MDGTQLSGIAEGLKTALGAERVILQDASPLAGGAIQENWGVTATVEGGGHAGTHGLVVRTDAPSSLSMSIGKDLEFKAMRAAFEAGMMVPEPLYNEPTGRVLGKPFFVMRRATGTANPRTLTRDDAVAGDRGALANTLGREIAKLHSIKPPQDGLADLLAPNGTPVARRIGEFRALLDALPDPAPVLEWGTRWLSLNEPSSQSVALCHGDYRTGNYMVDGGVLTGVLDWEFASWSDPLEDIGWLCARCWRFGADDRPVGGIGPREDLYAGYEAEAGSPLNWDLVPYWEVLATVRWAIIARHQGQRHLSGAQSSLELALTGRKAAEMELDVLTQIRRIDAGGA